MSFNQDYTKNQPNIHAIDSQTVEYLTFIDIMRLTMQWRKIIFIGAIIGAVSGLSYSQLSKKYRTQMVIGDEADRSIVVTNASAVNTITPLIFRKGGVATAFAKQFFNSMNLLFETPSVTIEIQRAICQQYELNCIPRQDGHSSIAIKELDSAARRMAEDLTATDLSFIQLAYNDPGTWRISITNSVNQGQGIIFAAAIDAFNSAASLHNSNLMLAASQAQQIQIKRLESEVTAIRELAAKRSILAAQSKGDLNARFYKLRIKIDRLFQTHRIKSEVNPEDAFLNLLDSSPTLVMTLSKEEKLVQNIPKLEEDALLKKISEFASYGYATTQEIDNFVKELIEIKSGREALDFEAVPIELKYRSAITALMTAHEESLKPFEAKDRGLPLISDDWKPRIDNLIAGRYTTKSPVVWQSTLLGLAAGVLLMMLAGFLTLIFRSIKAA